MIKIVKHHPASLELKWSMNTYCYCLKTTPQHQHTEGLMLLVNIISETHWLGSFGVPQTGVEAGGTAVRSHQCRHTCALLLVEKRLSWYWWHPVRDTSPEGASRPPEAQVLHMWLWAPSSKVRSQNRGWRHAGLQATVKRVCLTWDGALASCPDTLAEMNVSHE